jgi:tRNA-Thr(GGU) m(6)t(6)A37 methyltransferase TsaA
MSQEVIGANNILTNLNIIPIGIVESCYPDKFGTPRQPGLVKEALAKILIHPQSQPKESLSGLEGFSHLWIIFWFHQNKAGRFHAKIHPPRLEGKTMGVFATRTPHRPNPIGLSLVEIVKILHDGVLVRGADLISGTPVLDIKPYLPEVEAVPNAKQGWTSVVDEKPTIQIEWSDEAWTQFQAWSSRRAAGAAAAVGENLQELIENTIKLDPRPTVYKGYEDGDSPYRSTHAVRFYDGDVHFQFLSQNLVRILKVLA